MSYLSAIESQDTSGDRRRVSGGYELGGAMSECSGGKPPVHVRTAIENPSPADADERWAAPVTPPPVRCPISHI